jgi:CRP-like cAMP-binding protein
MYDLQQRLAQAPVFEKLPAREIDTLVTQAVMKRLRPGEFLCHQGDDWRYAAFLARGGLRWAILSVGGREQVLFRVEPGHTFWAHSLFDCQPMPASLSATKASTAYLWPEEVIAPILSRNPALLWEILCLMMGVMRRAREVIYGLAFKPVAGRLAKLLLEQSAGQEGQHVQREMTLSEIAATVATSQEVVCRLLYQFQADKIIELNRASFKLNDRAALEDLVEKP